MKLVGFWRQSEGEDGDLPHPRALVDASWALAERVRVAMYLRRGQVARAYLGHSFCRLECGLPVQFMGTRDLTDGEWVWPEGFAHYVEHHSVKPPAEFLQAIAERLPRPFPTWRLGARTRSFILQRRIAAARREAEADALLPPHTTPLHVAATAGDLAGIEREIAGVDVNLKNRLGETALHLAARAGHVDIVELLLRRGADVHAKDNSNITPLAEARGTGVAERLLDAGAEVEPEPTAHSSPLTTACMQDDLAHVKLLLDRGASANRGDRFRTPLESSRSIAVALLLCEHGADAAQGSPLASVARYGDAALVRLLLSRGADPNACDTRSQTPLFHAAASKDGDEIVAILLEAHADPERGNDLADTPLHMACARSSIATVKRLLGAGAKLGTKSRRGMTPLHWAALAPERRDDTAAVLELLLAAGAASRDTRDEWGRTPLMIAEERNDDAAARVLRRDA